MCFLIQQDVTLGETVYVFIFCKSSLLSQTDRLFALSRLKQSGAYLTTTEAVLLQLVQDAKHPNFKEVLTATALLLCLFTSVSMCYEYTCVFLKKTKSRLQGTNA